MFGGDFRKKAPATDSRGAALEATARLRDGVGARVVEHALEKLALVAVV